MGRFRTFLENTEVSGEFWIADGHVQEAGGDGDYNHEAYALDQVQREVGNNSKRPFNNNSMLKIYLMQRIKFLGSPLMHLASTMKL